MTIVCLLPWIPLYETVMFHVYLCLHVAWSQMASFAHVTYSRAYVPGPLWPRPTAWTGGQVVGVEHHNYS